MNGERYLPASILQVIGLVLLVAAAIFWAFTQKESALLVSAAMSLILLGKFRDSLQELRRRDKPPSPPDKD